jgi:hypothetical protein
MNRNGKNMLTPLLALALVSNPLPPDKAAHFGMSYVVNHVCYTVMKTTTHNSKLTDTVVCTAGTIVLGGIKEIIDPYTGGKRELGDFAADVMGAGFAVTIINLDF